MTAVNDAMTGYTPTSEPIGHLEPVPSPSHDERLAQVLCDPAARAANLRTTLDDDAQIILDAISANVEGIMSERGVGPRSPYVTHHMVAAVAKQAVYEALHAAGVIEGQPS